MQNHKVRLAKCTQQQITSSTRDADRSGLVHAAFVASPWARLFYAGRGIRKWHFSDLQPRDEEGRWTNGDGGNASFPLVAAQYRGRFHDIVVDDFVNGLKATGSKVLKSVPIVSFNGIIAIPDIGTLPKGKTLPNFFEVKTGDDPTYTTNQRLLYPLLCIGGHVTSPDPRITELGLIPGVPFPPLDIFLVRTIGPGMPIEGENICKTLGLRGPIDAP